MPTSSSDTREALDLIRRALAGEPSATLEFQQIYGELIYGYPIRVYRLPADEAGDFYVFAFDQGRIFRRLRTFEGRAPLRAYLLGFVLDDLVLEWKRGQREIETVPIESVGELPDGGDTMRGFRSTAGGGNTTDPHPPIDQILGDLAPPKSVVMKLLYIEDCELSPSEIRYVAEVSGRSIADVLQQVEELRAVVREREAAVKQEEDALETVQAWIQLYQRRVQRVQADLAELAPSSPIATRLREEQSDLERKIERRRHQQEKLLARTRRRKVTAPYKQVAAILNTTTGNVGSQIARLRQELSALPSIRGAVVDAGTSDDEQPEG
ncbi:MAG TPA: hypothetical protein VMW17_04040 [Candidatus Binatia bacterium]|nr:hypothetical protein [Candidatus Binatia bacterium]